MASQRAIALCRMIGQIFSCLWQKALAHSVLGELNTFFKVKGLNVTLLYSWKKKSHISSIKSQIVDSYQRSWLLTKCYKSFVPDNSLTHPHLLHIFLTAEYCENLSQNLQLRENHKCRENHQSSKKKTLYTVLPAFQNLSPSPSNTHINT